MSRPAGGSTAGRVTLTGTASRTGAGQPVTAASMAQASQRAHSRGPYSANGENSPHPAGPSISAPSRTVTPLNFTGIGIANARNPASIPPIIRRSRDRVWLPPEYGGNDKRCADAVVWVARGVGSSLAGRALSGSWAAAEVGDAGKKDHTHARGARGV